ncbi:MAG: ferritin [Eubacteriales bacterium]|nr:ferritin [Eubacteriales bacterium]
MLTEKTIKLLNKQINEELYSAYLYLEFANYLTDLGYVGYAHWYNIQVREETDHAMTIYNYLQQNGVKPVLEAIAKPEIELNGLLNVTEEGLKHEQHITASIHKIYDVAHDEKDFRTMKLLDWFIEEQGEEEENANALIQEIKLYGDDKNALYALDKDKLARAYSPSTPDGMPVAM